MKVTIWVNKNLRLGFANEKSWTPLRKVWVFARLIKVVGGHLWPLLYLAVQEKNNGCISTKLCVQLQLFSNQTIRVGNNCFLNVFLMMSFHIVENLSKLIKFVIAKSFDWVKSLLGLLDIALKTPISNIFSISSNNRRSVLWITFCQIATFFKIIF